VRGGRVGELARHEKLTRCPKRLAGYRFVPSVDIHDRVGLAETVGHGGTCSNAATHFRIIRPTARNDQSRKIDRHMLDEPEAGRTAWNKIDIGDDTADRGRHLPV